MNTNSGLAAALAPTGPLRAAINLGNPVLAQGTPEDPRGVTVDLARELAGRLEVEVRFNCHQAARNSFEDLVAGRADIAFLATEPARAGQVTFTSPYAVIEAVYAFLRNRRCGRPTRSTAQAYASVLNRARPTTCS